MIEIKRAGASKEAIAKLYDAATDAVIEASAIDIVRLEWDKAAGFLEVRYVLGGVNQRGEFIQDMQRQPAKYRFGRGITPKLWAENELDSGCTIEKAEALLVQDKAAIGTVGRIAWKVDAIKAKNEVAKEPPALELPRIGEMKTP